MVSVIECIWKQALQTFERSSTLQSFEDNFARLKSLSDSVCAADVKFDRRLLEWSSNSISHKTVQKAPVTYIEIYEDHIVTIGVFVLRSGARIPLHDHPQMHGILKVLAGTVKIQSYDLLPPVEQEAIRKRCAPAKLALLAAKLPEVFVNERAPACVLTPEKGNLHEVYSVDGPAAFLDILAPPYDSLAGGDRSCHYFQEIMLDDDRWSNNIAALFHIPSPPDFWSDFAPYTGPTLRKLD